MSWYRSPEVRCRRREFLCTATSMCIDINDKCDGMVDCEEILMEVDGAMVTRGAEDELSCTGPEGENL